MNGFFKRTAFKSWLISIIIVVLTREVNADPPTRVALLRDISGEVSFLPAGEDKWIAPMRNRPLMNGDRLWNDNNAQSVLKLGAAAICMDENTGITILNFNDRIAQFQLVQGTLNLRVDHIQKGQEYEIDTPNLAFSVRYPGNYRINVDADGNVTTVAVRSGRAEVYGEGMSYVIEEPQSYRFGGTDLHDSQPANLGVQDNLDKWCQTQSQRTYKAPPIPYVSEEITGYEDLYRYGTWQDTPNYGPVWTPSQVSADWAPYRDGRWVWIEPWGWTWIGDEAWGFAPYHYGRWIPISGKWCWIPGPIDLAPVYAPALVGFIGGSLFKLSAAAGGHADIAWFPLAPSEVYRPSYPFSQTYFTNVNLSNSAINTRIVAQAYTHPNMKTLYRNLQAPNAITAVPINTFVQAKLINKTRVTVPEEKIAKAPITQYAPVAPELSSLLGSEPSNITPPEEVMARGTIAKLKLPPPQISFKIKQPLLKQDPGKTLSPVILATLEQKEPLLATLQLIKPKKPTKMPPAAGNQSWINTFVAEKDQAPIQRKHSHGYFMGEGSSNRYYRSNPRHVRYGADRKRTKYPEARRKPIDIERWRKFFRERGKN